MLRFFYALVLFFGIVTGSYAFGVQPKEGEHVVLQSKEGEHVVLQLHWKYEYNFIGFIIAKEKGFYKDVGLDVELREYRYGMDVEDEVLSKRANYGIYNSKLLLDYLKGKPIKLLASFFKRSALVLVTQKEIDTLKKLKGKKVMAATKKDFAINFKPYFDKYGVEISSIHLVPHTYRVDEFMEKKVDAMTAFFSNEIVELKDKGYEFHIFDPSNDNLFVMQLELFTSKSEFYNNPIRTKKFLQASIKGWEYAFSHKKEAVEIMYAKYNRGYTKKELYEKADAIEKLVLPYTYEIGSVDKGFLKKQAELFRKNYHIKTDKTIQGYAYLPYKTQGVEFSYEELRYIQTHPQTSLCILPNLFPIDGVEGEKQTGIMGEVFDLIAKKSGLHFKVVAPKTNKDLIEKVVNNECDVVSLIQEGLAKELHLQQTKPLFSSYFTVVTSTDNSFIKNPKRLVDEIFLVQNKEFLHCIEKRYPSLHLQLVQKWEAIVQMIRQNKAYGVILLDEQSDYFIDQYGYGRLKIGGFLSKTSPINGSIGISENNKILADIINKTLKNIPPAKIDAIKNSWHLTRYHKQMDYILVFEVLVVMGLLFGVMFYYQRKLKIFNVALETSVDEKTKELREINEHLEALVQEKVEEIIQKDRLLAIRSKQAIMGEMITMIAHQWRQPLNTVTLQISKLQLRRLMGDKVGIEEYDKVLEEISAIVAYLSSTIDDFQTFFHADRELSKVQLSELLQKALNFILPRTNGSSIVIDITIEEDIEVNVYINEIIQVLLNILNNAIDALQECNKEEKKITIVAKLIQDKVQIIISDTACGIKEEIIEKLFEPYFSTKGKNGTGLGLYMSQMIMQKQFGGDIYLQTSSKGSSFTIEFPKL